MWDVWGSHLPLVVPLWRLQGLLLLSSQMPGLTRDASGRIILCPQVGVFRGGGGGQLGFKLKGLKGGQVRGSGVEILMKCQVRV